MRWLLSGFYVFRKFLQFLSNKETNDPKPNPSK